MADTACALGVSESTVRQLRRRFLQDGEAGLVDRREDNGLAKLDEQYLATLYEVVTSSPREHGFARPTWTREMLVEVKAEVRREDPCEHDESHVCRDRRPPRPPQADRRLPLVQSRKNQAIAADRSAAR